MLVTTDLFLTEKGGYHNYHVPGIIQTRDGTLIAYCEARRSVEWGDWADIDLMIKRSTDNGKTWLPRQILAGSPDVNGVTYNNPVAVCDDHGITHFFYCRDYSRLFHVWSQDDGKTFTNPIEITHPLYGLHDQCPWNICASGPGHAIQLSSGRILLPVWIGLGEKLCMGNPRAIEHGSTSLAVIYSDDYGDTWNDARLVVKHSEQFPNPNESISTQLHDGRIMISARSPSSKNKRLVVYSDDQGETWGTPEFHDEMFDPLCHCGLHRYPNPDAEGNTKLLYSAPDSGHLESNLNRNGSKRYPRENLSVFLSKDNGKTWPVKKVLESGEAGYSDLVVTADGTIGCIYVKGTCMDKFGRKRHAGITFSRFDEKWLLT